MATPEFWQVLSEIEAEPAKSWKLIQDLPASAFLLTDKDAIIEALGLDPIDKSRAVLTRFDSLKVALAKGGRFVDYNEFSPAAASARAAIPPALACIGDVEALKGPAVGIVGTRSASVYGKGVAKKFAQSLGAAGITIVSGGAIGIDAASHEGALTVGAQTISVLASGLDFLYPAMNRGLFARVEASGALVSSYPYGMLPMPHRFLARNRVIAGLSLAVLVVEAPEQSGALSTAEVAKQLGRPVFVAPATIDNIKFKGSHKLIRAGATLVDEPEQILEALGIRTGVAQPTLSLSGEAGKKLVAALSTEPSRLEVVAAKAGVSEQDALSELTLLELEGKVHRAAGGYALVP